jgi:hypothetical protein
VAVPIDFGCTAAAGTKGAIMSVTTFFGGVLDRTSVPAVAT